MICQTCAPAPISLLLGNQLLLERDPAYPAEGGRKYKVREHTVQAVAEAVSELARPADEWLVDLPTGIESALDVFVGYVMLDAWIANQDRHHENWAALRSDELRLAPTFDHGASLARNLSDEERKERRTTKDQNYRIPHFAAKAKSEFYAESTESRPLGTVEAFAAFAQLARPAAQAWLQKLERVERAAIQEIFDEVPPKRMSKIAKEFTLELLAVNQQRLIQERIP